MVCATTIRIGRRTSVREKLLTWMLNGFCGESIAPLAAAIIEKFADIGLGSIVGSA